MENLFQELIKTASVLGISVEDRSAISNEEIGKLLLILDLKPTGLYLWESPSTLFSKTIVTYSSESWEKEFEAIRQNLVLNKILLVISDDNYPPWPMVEILFIDLFRLLSNCPYFEYFIFDNSYTWVIFDTHDNQLIRISI